MLYLSVLVLYFVMVGCLHKVVHWRMEMEEGRESRCLQGQSSS